ncbi:MAG: hypothetical protein GF332_01635 [Candidatus Moranbacteria bacterium]|nr:hypothetical protein [Candidatus Moranbacteria bacterium]
MLFIKNNPVKKIFIFFLLIITFLGVFYYLYTFKKDQNQKQTNKTQAKIIIKGSIIDLLNQKPLENVRVQSKKINFLTSQTDKNGEFEIKTYPNDILLISGLDFYEQIEIPIENRKNIQIALNSKALAFFRKIEKAEEQRQYRKIYPFIVNSIDENHYLAKKNNWRDNIVQKGFLGPKTVKIDREVQIKENQYQTSIRYVFQKENQDLIKKYSFVFNNDLKYLDQTIDN